MDIWYSFAKSMVRGYLSLFVDKINVSGGSMLPGGPKIIVANHTNVSDAFVLPFLTKEKIHFLIQAETFTLPVIGRLLSGTWQTRYLSIWARAGSPGDCPREAEPGPTLWQSSQRENWTTAGAFIAPGRVRRSWRSRAACLSFRSAFLSQTSTLARSRGIFIREIRSVAGSSGGQCFVRIGDPWQLTASIQEKVNYRELRKTTEKMMTRVAELVQLARGRSPAAGRFYSDRAGELATGCAYRLKRCPQLRT